jgi:hypothetical protein
MGSIVSHLADIIKLYGSYDNYLKEMEEVELAKKTKGKTTPIFLDSEGHKVWDGSVIKIDSHLGNEDLNGTTAIVKWDSSLGRYGYQLDYESENLRAFDLVSRFVVIG